MTDPHYQPHYCEENIWHLARDERVKGINADVLFISNSAKCCAMWCQKAAPSPEQPVLWDYHVILLTRGDTLEIWDFDSTLEAPVDAKTYLAETWKNLDTVPDAFQPRFRLISSEEYLSTLSSDRSHMLVSENSYKEDPPQWPPIIAEGEAQNLHRLMNMDLPYIGKVVDLETLRAEVG